MASQIWFTRSVDVDSTQVQTEGGYMPFQSQEVIEPWRISLLTKFLEIRMNNLYADFNITKNQVKSMIDSLCV